MKQTELLEQYQEKILSATDNIGDENFDVATAEMTEAINLVKGMQENRETIKMMTENFGVAYNVVNTNMERLIKEEKEFVAAWVKTLKNDKNLRGEVMFYESLKRYKTELDPTQYLTESLNMCDPYIDKATIKESLGKVSELIKKSGIVFENSLKGSKALGLFEKCQTLLETKQSHNTLTTIFEARKTAAESLAEAIDKNAVAINDIKSTKLTIEEAALVKAFAGSEDDKKGLFETLQNECLGHIDEKLEMCDCETDKQDLTQLKENIAGMTYNAQGCFNDISKFLGALDILGK